MKTLTQITFILFLGSIIFSCTKDPIMSLEDCESATVIELLNTSSATCGSAAGSIEVQEKANITYSIEDQNFTSSGQFENLAPGIYEITAKDEMNCTTSEKFNVFSNISLSNDVIPIFKVSCALSTCHVNGDIKPEFQNKSNIIKFADQIRIEVVNKTMPLNNSPGPFLTDEEISIIACWVDDGAKDN